MRLLWGDGGAVLLIVMTDRVSGKPLEQKMRRLNARGRCSRLLRCADLEGVGSGKEGDRT